MLIVEPSHRAAFEPPGVSEGRDHRDEPLACLRDEAAVRERFHFWCGRSGQRYLATVYPIDHDDPAAALPDLGPAVLMAVARCGRSRSILHRVAVERGSDWRSAVFRLHRQADEWHVHLLAPNRAARAAVLADLRPVCTLAIAG